MNEVCYKRGLLLKIDDDPGEHEALQGRRGIERSGLAVAGYVGLASRGAALDRGNESFARLHGPQEPELTVTQSMTLQLGAGADQQHSIGSRAEVHHLRFRIAPHIGLPD